MASTASIGLNAELEVKYRERSIEFHHISAASLNDSVKLSIL